jgi:hypothetical protein
VAAFSQNELEEQITCPKEVSEPPRREMKLDGAHWRNDAKLVASNAVKGEFAIFMRKSEDFPENFSIGLIYSPHDGRGEIILFRCNGKHGDFNRSFDPTHPHFDYHVHRASEDAIEAGQAPEKSAVKTAGFAPYEEALQFFVKEIGLNAKDAKKHFPLVTPNLFELDQ